MNREVFVVPKREVNYGEIGQNIAQPFAQQQNVYQALIPLLFKAQMEKQNKLDELELEHQFEMRKIQDFKNLNPDTRVRAKLQGGKIVLESLDRKQESEEAAAGREPQLGRVLAYIQKASQRGAPPTLTGEATQRFTTPEEIKSIMGAYETGKKARPKIMDIIKRTAYTAYQAGDRRPETLKALGLYISPMEALQAEAMGFGSESPKGEKSKKTSTGGKRIRVRLKSNKQTGTILPDEFDSDLYEKL